MVNINSAIKYHKKRIKELRQFIYENENTEFVKGYVFTAKEDVLAHELRLKELEGKS